jgi:molecular chaperone GrpE
MNDIPPSSPSEFAPANTPNAAATATPLEQELAAQKDRYLRLAADFENFKRRTAQDAERRATAQKDTFIVELLPVMDNLERALAARSSAPEQLRIGVEMTLLQLDRLLRSHGCEPVEGCGQPFDPRCQEAIGSQADPVQPDHVVLEVVQRGWRRGDHLLRPARVIINDLSHAPRENGPDIQSAADQRLDEREPRQKGHL